jgi:hypothetical protein
MNGVAPASLLPDAAALDIDGPVARYRREGFARLGPVLGEDVLAPLRRRCDQIMLGEVQIPGLFFQHDGRTGSYGDLPRGLGWQGPSLAYRKIEKLERDELFAAVIGNALFGRIARAVHGGPVALYRAVLFTKSAEGGSHLPWHQDGGTFWGLDRAPILQIWTALDDVPAASGCVEVIPGSHPKGLATPLGGVIPDDVAAAHGAEARAVPLPARAGEALLLHNHVWHRSGVNRTGRPRRALTICYMSAETRCTRKKRAPREFLRVFD